MFEDARDGLTVEIATFDLKRRIGRNLRGGEQLGLMSRMKVVSLTPVIFVACARLKMPTSYSYATGAAMPCLRRTVATRACVQRLPLPVRRPSLLSTRAISSSP